MSVLSVWSDDDWLKKFSGKTTEESEEAVSASGEPANTTTTQEVRYCTDDVDHLGMYFLFHLTCSTNNNNLPLY